MLKLQQLLLYCIAPVVCSVVIGFVFFHARVFDRHHPAFQFIAISVIASIFYYLLILARPRDAFLGLAFLLVLQFIIARSTRPVFILRDLLFVGAIGLAILLYFRYFRRPRRPAHLYPPIVLAVFYGLAYLVAGEVNLLIISMFSTLSFRESYLTVASSTVPFGIAVGFAVGCGFALNDKFAPATAV